MSGSDRRVDSVEIEEVLGHQQNSLQDFSILDGSSTFLSYRSRLSVACASSY